jgi:hypothetical protein
MGSTDNEGDGVMNWDATEGINQSFADIVTTTLFTCNMALESRSVPCLFWGNANDKGSPWLLASVPFTTLRFGGIAIWVFSRP